MARSVFVGVASILDITSSIIAGLRMMRIKGQSELFHHTDANH